MAADGVDVPATVDADRVRRRLVVAAAACVGFGLGLTACDYGGWPRLFYLPYQRAWLLAAEPPIGVSMVFFGTLLWALGGAAVAGASAALGLRAWARPVPVRLVWLAAAWAGTALVLAAAYTLWSLFPF